MKTITVTNNKGGVGKSTTAVHLAGYLSTIGSTLLVDLDPNLTAIEWAKRGSLPFDVVEARDSRPAMKGRAFVVIDTQARPDSDDLSQLASRCDLLLLPTPPDLVSVLPMVETARSIRGGCFRIAITMSPPAPSQEGMRFRDKLAASGFPLCRTMIRRSINFAHASNAGVLVRDLSSSRPASVAAAWGDYVGLGKELLEVME